MTKYLVESRREFVEDFDNWTGDYIIAEDKEEAVEFYKDWLIENGCEPEEVEEMEYRVSEYRA